MYPFSLFPVQRRNRFPRTRGDVPPAKRNRPFVAGLPPHTRGCTFRADFRQSFEGASPAHAGMYPGLSIRAAIDAGFPRTRGDVPWFVYPCCDRRRLPPHTRGCTLQPGLQRRRRLASPAHAGMYRQLLRWLVCRLCFPRTRGDVPEVGVYTWYEGELPPHTRGCTHDVQRYLTAETASPAHAGMYPGGNRKTHISWSFPRTRGDVPIQMTAARYSAGLPPHTRGCTGAGAGETARPRASPAHAGMYLGQRGQRAREKGFPRTRGDVPSDMTATPMRRPLPPHTRGCTRIVPPEDGAVPASPAHAGMYPWIS